MKLTHKQILSSIMIAGDIFMALIALILIFEESLAFFGIVMLGFLAIDIYLTIDYIKALNHRIKVEQSLKSDNARAADIRRRFNDMSLSEEAQRRKKEEARARLAARRAVKAAADAKITQAQQAVHNAQSARAAQTSQPGVPAAADSAAAEGVEIEDLESLISNSSNSAGQTMHG